MLAVRLLALLHLDPAHKWFGVHLTHVEAKTKASQPSCSVALLLQVKLIGVVGYSVNTCKKKLNSIIGR